MALTILIVDDEPLMRRMMHSTVREVLPDADIHVFGDAEEVLEFARNHTVAIAFLDIQMRGITGTELAKQLRPIQPRINIIFCTAYDEYKGSAMDLRASGYLMKPVQADDIRSELQVLRFPLEDEIGEPQSTRLKVVCFGDFQVSFQGKLVPFRYSKTTELFAFLIDRKGALCSYEFIADALWEGTGLHYSYMKRIRQDLISVLKNLGLSDVLLVRKGQLGIVPEKIDCDYFEYLSRKPGTGSLYNGEYMTQFSWAEETNAQLWWEKDEQEV